MKLGEYIGARDETAARHMWESLPAIEEHPEATGVSMSPPNLILLKISRKSYWCNLVFHPCLLRRMRGGFA